MITFTLSRDSFSKTEFFKAYIFFHSYTQTTIIYHKWRKICTKKKSRKILLDMDHILLEQYMVFPQSRNFKWKRLFLRENFFTLIAQHFTYTVIF